MLLQVGAAPWFSMPHLADDNYHRHGCQLAAHWLITSSISTDLLRLQWHTCWHFNCCWGLLDVKCSIMLGATHVEGAGACC